MVSMLAAVISGLIMGMIFFGGLWWTVGQLAKTKRPKLFLAASFALRTVLTLTVGYVVCADQFVLIVAYLIGFIASRTIILHKINQITAFNKHKGAENA